MRPSLSKVLAATAFLLAGFSSLHAHAFSSSDEVRPDTTLSATDGLGHATRIERYSALHRQRWSALAPRQIFVQHAGNIGQMSFGLGWDYGRKSRWETHLLLGYMPRYYSDRAKATLTLRELYLPWDVLLARQRPILHKMPKTSVHYAPLTVGYALNTVFDRDFWTHQPERYPHGYYWFSTRLRSHLSVGQRITHTFTADNRFGLHGYSVYWEVSTTELDVIYKIQNHWVPVRDILHLGVGLKLQIL